MQDRPNLLLIMLDQCRADVLGEAGTWVKTPNMDRLAAEGVTFTNCVTTTPVCIPARVSMATGHYPHSTHVWENQEYSLAPETPTWMKVIRDAGYRTSLFGKTHLHPHDGDAREREHMLHAYGLDDVNETVGPRASARVVCHMTHSWDEAGLWKLHQADYAERFANKPWVVRPSALPLEHYYDVYVAQQAKRYLAGYDRDQPWFCWVSFGGPHEPWDTPEPYASMYDPAAMPAPVSDVEPGSPLGHRADIPMDEILRMRADYAANVTLIDDQIGELLATLEARGELANTAIILTSDHGEMNGDHGRIYKSNFHDGAVRVPLIVRSPQTAGSARGGAICTHLSEWIDAGPTLVELAGAKLEYEQFGQSLLPAVHDARAAHRPDALAEYRRHYMLLNQRWKAVFSPEAEILQLFDVMADHGELCNLAGQPQVADVERALSLRLLQRLTESQASSAPFITY